MARRKVVVPSPTGEDWKTWVTWPSQAEAQRSRCTAVTGQFLPSVVILRPSLTAKHLVTGEISRAASEELAGPNPTDTATTVMKIRAHGLEGSPVFRIPNASVLCYGDYRFLTPEVLALPCPDEVKGYPRFNPRAIYLLSRMVDKMTNRAPSYAEVDWLADPPPVDVSRILAQAERSRVMNAERFKREYLCEPLSSPQLKIPGA